MIGPFDFRPLFGFLRFLLLMPITMIFMALSVLLMVIGFPYVGDDLLDWWMNKV